MHQLKRFVGSGGVAKLDFARFLFEYLFQSVADDRMIVSDGDPNTITVPAGMKPRVKPAYASRVVERPATGR